MAVLTVREIIETLSRGYNPDESLAITWWSSEDVGYVVEDEDISKISEIWEEIADQVSGALEQQIGWVNDVLADAVSEHLTEEEDD